MPKMERREGAVSAQYLPCPKNDTNEPIIQLYRGTARYRQKDDGAGWQRYDVFLCECTGRRHYNRLIVGHYQRDVKIVEHGYCKPGHSIFGQTLSKARRCG